MSPENKKDKRDKKYPFRIRRIGNSWIFEGLTTRKLSITDQKKIQPILSTVSSVVPKIAEEFKDILIINPTEELIKTYPLAFHISENMDDNDDSKKCEKYKIFNTNMFIGTCHNKKYIIFPEQKILIPLKICALDELNIVKKLSIELILRSDGTIHNQIESCITTLFS